MFEAPGSEYLVPFDSSFRVSNAGTQPRTNGWKAETLEDISHSYSVTYAQTED